MKNDKLNIEKNLNLDFNTNSELKSYFILLESEILYKPERDFILFESDILNVIPVSYVHYRSSSSSYV